MSDTDVIDRPRAETNAVPAADADPILAIENLTTVFPTIDGDVRAVEDVSFVIRPGETVAVVGESGSGKSVTAKSILRLTDYQNAEVRRGTVRSAPGTARASIWRRPARRLCAPSAATKSRSSSRSRSPR